MIIVVIIIIISNLTYPKLLNGITDSTNLLISTTVFNIDNNKKYFLSTKSVY